MGLVKIHIPQPARSGRRSLVQLARTGGWYDDDTFPKLLDMRQSCFIRKLQNRRKSLGSARIVLCRKDGAGKGTIPTEHSRKGGTIPAKHATRADYLSLFGSRSANVRVDNHSLTGFHSSLHSPL